MAQNEIWLLVGLFSVAIPLIALARRADISYPVVLVLGGLVLGFIPGLPRIELDPDLVLVIFLPPLLYWEAITAPTDVMRANAGQIAVLAIGLVVATTVVVAAVAHATVGNLSWAMAFVLGAIVAPTDELASIPVLERLKVPRHVIAIVEGESLLNDASSLILYVTAIGVVATHAYRWGTVLTSFVVSGVGGIALGLLAGRLAIEAWRRIKDTQLQGVISFSLPFLAYSLAGRLGVSGVLAVVFAGLYVNRLTAVVITPASRLQVSGFWDTLVFLANAALFLLVGLQLHELVQAVLQEYSLRSVLWYALVVNVTVIATRFTWLFAQEHLPVIGAASEHPEGDNKHALIASWSGLRGAVSLAAALAIPVTIGGMHVPHRNLVIFLTFTVILVTLVGGGLSLPLVVKRLNVDAGTEESDDVRAALRAMSDAALATIAEGERDGRIAADDAWHLRSHYEHLLSSTDGSPTDATAARVATERDVIAAQRAALVDLRNRGEIDNTVQRKLQRILDLEQARLPPPDDEDED